MYEMRAMDKNPNHSLRFFVTKLVEALYGIGFKDNHVADESI